MPKRTASLVLSGDPEADKLLSREPLALLIGMVLDQQVPLEWAFHGPLELKQRMGGRLDASEIAATDPDELRALFSKPPALHRFPGSMATRVQELCRLLVDDYGGEAEAVWKGASSGRDLLRRVKALPGFGDQKAKIFVALLGKQLGVRPPGWEEAAGDYARAGTFMSVADITSTESLARVRKYKQERKAAARASSAASSGAPSGASSPAGG